MTPLPALPAGSVEWQLTDVSSPQLDAPVSVIAALNMPYIANANRFQNLSLYLPATPETTRLVGAIASYLPYRGSGPGDVRYLVHIHGGAWRDPQLTSSSIEPTVAHAFAGAGRSEPIIAIAAINYTISEFPTHPTLPYDAIRDNHTDPAREGAHPQHVSDVLHSLSLLRSLGLSDQSYILSGHSCGACLALQATLQSPRHYGLGYLPDAPCPAALLGLNGLYDLPQLVDGLGAAHARLGDDYEMLLSNAFGADRRTWPGASPARFDPPVVAARVRDGKAPNLVVLEQSAEDQLVPMSQRELLRANLDQATGLRVVEGDHLNGSHAAVWEHGSMLWESVRGVVDLLPRSQ